MVETRSKRLALKAQKRDELSVSKASNPSSTPPNFVSPSTTSILGATAKTVDLIDWWLINVGGKELGIGGFNSMELKHFVSVCVSILQMFQLHFISLITFFGHIPRNSQLVRFTSAAISKRHSETVVETNDGFMIGISCSLNRENTLQNGFPLKVCTKFMHGFPYDWDDYRSGVDKSCAFGSDDSVGKNLSASLNDLPVSSVRDLLLSTLGHSSYDLIINSVEKTPLTTYMKHSFQRSRASEARNVTQKKENCASTKRHVKRGIPKIQPGVITRSMSRMRLRNSKE